MSTDQPQNQQQPEPMPQQQQPEPALQQQQLVPELEPPQLQLEPVLLQEKANLQRQRQRYVDEPYRPTLRIMNRAQAFYVNWSNIGNVEERRDDNAADYTVFVGNLDLEVTEKALLKYFQEYYQSVKGAKIVIDRYTGRSKGYGFVRFGNECELLDALDFLNHQKIEIEKNIIEDFLWTVTSAQYTKNKIILRPAANYKIPACDVIPYTEIDQPTSEQKNRTIFVDGLYPSLTVEDLREQFGKFGELVFVRIPVGKRYGFVQFTDRFDAKVAMMKLGPGAESLPGIRLSWAGNPSNKQFLQSLADQLIFEGPSEMETLEIAQQHFWERRIRYREKKSAF